MGDEARNLYRQGTAALSAGNAEAAISLFEKALQYETTWPILANLGAAQSHLKRYAEAAENLTAALMLDPQSPQARANRGTCYYELGRFREALEDHDAVIRFDPTNPSYFLNRSMSRRKLGDCRGALADCADGLALRFSPGEGWLRRRLQYERALVHYESHAFRAAIEEIDIVLSAQPRDGWAWRRRGAAKLQLGQVDSALKDYLKGFGLADGALGDRLHEALRRFREERYADAIKLVELAAENDDALAPLAGRFRSELGAG